ncbi:MAG: hydrogenase maturation nickel metallochaperone HypA [Candidatus Cloacimonetes bacterium]|nr:hydrogenase maturation nickel metallochaperone HypA [Candidatus Cloacimonadota bacterium]
MHETALIHSLLKIAHKVKIQHNLTNIAKINITVGEMHQIIPTAMQNSFELLKPEFPGFLSAQLIIKITPLKIRCNNCHQIISLNQPNFRCPHCHSTSTTIISGKELYIESLEPE